MIIQIAIHYFFAICIGFFLAVMDRTNEEVAFNNSVFRNLNPKWWVRSISWEYVKFIPFTKYRPDAWHLAKSFAILCIGLTASTTCHVTKSIILNAVIVGAIITASFVLFYDYILKRKRKQK